MIEHMEKKDLCDHPACKAARNLSARLTTLVSDDPIALPLIVKIMHERDCSFSEALLSGIEPMRKACIEVIAQEETEDIDERLREILDEQ